MNAVITAGGTIDGAYARLASARTKALAPVRGVTMVERTIYALREIGVERIAVVGSDDVSRAIGAKIERMIADRGSGSENVVAALDAWPHDQPMLYLTCDMPYITGDALRAFSHAVAPDALAMPLTGIDAFRARFPNAPPFGIALAGETVVNGGVFHIPAGGAPRARDFATALFEARKAPWRMATIAGPALLLKFAMKRLSVSDLERHATRVLATPVMAVRDAPAELAFDADTVDEYRYALDRE